MGVESRRRGELGTGFTRLTSNSSRLVAISVGNAIVLDDAMALVPRSYLKHFINISY